MLVTIEDNRSRHERRTIAVCPVTPQQMGRAGAAQLAKLQRTRLYPTFPSPHEGNRWRMIRQVTEASRESLPLLF